MARSPLTHGLGREVLCLCTYIVLTFDNGGVIGTAKGLGVLVDPLEQRCARYRRHISVWLRE